MNKKIIIISILIFIIILFFIKFNETIISKYILTKISKWTERTVTAESVDIKYFKKINFNNLEILNKGNFSEKNMFEVKKLVIEIEFLSLFTDLIKIKKFILHEPKFFFEIKDVSKESGNIEENTKDNIGLLDKITKQTKPKIYPLKKKDKNFLILESSIKNSKVFIRLPKDPEPMTIELSNMLFRNVGNANSKQNKNFQHYKDVLRLIMGDIYFRITDKKAREYLKEKYKIK